MYDEAQGEPFSEANTENKTKFHFNDAVSEQLEFYLDEAPWELRDQWRRFHGYQNGIWNWDWADKAKLYPQDNDQMFGAIAGQIGLTRFQKERAREIFRQIHFPTYSPYYRVMDIAFYVCVLVANEDYRGDGWVYYPSKKDYNHPRGDEHVRDGHEAFVEMADVLDLDSPTGKIQKGLHKFEPIVENIVRRYPPI